MRNGIRFTRSARLVALLLCVTLFSSSCELFRGKLNVKVPAGAAMAVKLSLQAAALLVEQLPDLFDAIGGALDQRRAQRAAELRQASRSIQQSDCLLRDLLPKDQADKLIEAKKKRGNPLAAALRELAQMDPLDERVALVAVGLLLEFATIPEVQQMILRLLNPLLPALRQVSGAGDQNRLLLAQAVYVVGVLSTLQGEFKAAEANLKEAQELRKGASLPDQDQQAVCVAEVLAQMGNLYFTMGSFDKSEDQYAQALKQLPESASERQADTLVGLATNHTQVADYEKADDEYQRAEQIYQTRLGAEHPKVASARHGRQGGKGQDGKGGEDTEGKGGRHGAPLDRGQRGVP